MKLLFASEFYPFPPRHGIELTLARLMTGLAARHELSFLLLEDVAAGGDASARLQADGWPDRRVLRGTRPAVRRAVMDELLLRRPTYCAWEFSPEAIRAACDPDVDVVFASPAGAVRFVEAFREAFPSSRARFVLGINDATYTGYLDHAMEVLRGSIVPTPALAARLLRVPWIAMHERRYLASVDAIHVQTAREARRVRRLLGRRAPRIVVAPNGPDPALLALPYTGAGTQDVLFMTHLVDARAQQARWFLERVWPRVRRELPSARVFLVGMPAPPELAAQIATLPGVVQCGFAPTLADAFAGKALSVVPVRQTSGLVTKVVDSLAAGVPVVGLEAVHTMDGFQDGVHGKHARNAEELAAAIVELLPDADRLERISRAGRELVTSAYSIERSVRTMDEAIRSLVEANAGSPSLQVA